MIKMSFICKDENFELVEFAEKVFAGFFPFINTILQQTI